MRLRRRPPFTLVLLAITAALAGTFVILDQSSSAPSSPPSLLESGPAKACVTARADVSASTRTSVQARVTARLPISVTERLQTKRAIVSVTRSGTIVEVGQLERPLAVTRSVTTTKRACAGGSSLEAARGVALTRAYQTALALARQRADATAVADARTLVARLTPGELAQARRVASAKADAAATSVRRVLARQALAQATAAAGSRGGSAFNSDH